MNSLTKILKHTNTKCERLHMMRTEAFYLSCAVVVIALALASQMKIGSYKFIYLIHTRARERDRNVILRFDLCIHCFDSHSLGMSPSSFFFRFAVWKFIESYKMQWKIVLWQRWQRQTSSTDDSKKMKHIYRSAVDCMRIALECNWKGLLRKHATNCVHRYAHFIRKQIQMWIK